MAMPGGNLVNWSSQFQPINNTSRRHIEDLFTNFGEFLIRNLTRAFRCDMNSKWFCNTDGISHLCLASICKTRGYHVLRNMSGCIAGASIHLRWVFTRKCSAAVTSPAAVRIHDDFSPCQTTISLRATDYETPRWVYMINRFAIQ